MFVVFISSSVCTVNTYSYNSRNSLALFLFSISKNIPAAHIGNSFETHQLIAAFCKKSSGEIAGIGEDEKSVILRVII